MKFPVIIYIRSIPIQVDSWDDLDEVIKRYGIDDPLAHLHITKLKEQHGHADMQA